MIMEMIMMPMMAARLKVTANTLHSVDTRQQQHRLHAILLRLAGLGWSNIHFSQSQRLPLP